MLTFTEEDIAFTNSWWNELCADEVRMNKWLQKLQVTELDGYYDNLESIVKFRNHIQFNSRIDHLLMKTASDERRHSDILITLLQNRGIHPLKDEEIPENKSYFWSEMEKCIVDVHTMAAVFYLGETLASFKFEVIKRNSNTPMDVRNFIDDVLPDEMFHARGYRMYTTTEALESVMSKYYETIEVLKSK